MPNNTMYNLILSNARRGELYNSIQYHLDEIKKRMNGREAFKPNKKLLAMMHQAQNIDDDEEIPSREHEEITGDREMALVMKRWEEKLNQERVLLKSVYLEKKPYRLRDEKVRDNRRRFLNSSYGDDVPFFVDIGKNSDTNGSDLVVDDLDDTFGVY